MKAKPAGERGPSARAVQQMFADIAHRYDFLNHFLSVSIDRRWRNIAAGILDQMVERHPGCVCLDLCSGTGDLALALHRRLQIPVVASDFCHPMLVQVMPKARAAQAAAAIRTVEADALLLPFADETFDAVTIAFGLRNLENRSGGLLEMRRILRPRGVAVILEFSRPVVPVFRQAFQFYFHRVLPRLGAWISGNPDAYEYLPDSVRNFPAQRELAGLMEASGFDEVGYRNLSGGIAALHWGRRL